ncbi:hypothetical protein JCM1393_04890 [Clostridium carnis]
MGKEIVDLTKIKKEKVKRKRTKIEKSLIIIATLALIGNWMYILLVWNKVPDIVPTHFGFSGEADAWGSKTSLIYMPIIVTIMYLIFIPLSRIPQYYNYVVEITKENKDRQYSNAVMLILIMLLEIIGLFIYMQWKNVQVSLGIYKGLGIGFLPTFLVVLFGTLGYFIYRMVKLK